MTAPDTSRMKPATARKVELAYRLGSLDRYAERPMLDVEDAGSAVLMGSLGEVSATTARNADGRLAMCDAYVDGWCDADSALR